MASRRQVATVTGRYMPLEARGHLGYGGAIMSAMSNRYGAHISTARRAVGGVRVVRMVRVVAVRVMRMVGVVAVRVVAVRAVAMSPATSSSTHVSATPWLVC